MKTFVVVVAAAVTAAPGISRAQEPAHVATSRAVVRVVERTTVAQTAEERIRQQERIRAEQQRAREQQERARQRAAERASQNRRDDREEQTEKVSRTLKLGAGGELDLSNLSGDIVVTRGGGSSVQVEAIKVARARTIEEARQMLADVTVDFVERGSRAEVKAVYPRRDERTRNGRNVNVSVHYTVTAPENTKLAARTLSGDIRVTDIKGDVNVVSMSGDVSVHNGVRVMSAKSTSGKVEITNLQSQIALEANTLSGDLVIRQSRASRMSLGTISGDLALTDVECSRIDVQTLSGDIEFTSSLAKNGRYELNSHSGSIRIVPAGGTGFELDANSFSGDIRSELTLKDQRQAGGDDDRRRPGPGGRHRSLRGTYGDGSAMLDITTFSGTVIIGKK